MKKTLQLLLFITATIQIAFSQVPNFQWAKQIGTAFNEESTSISVDAFGNNYFCGVFGGTTDFDPGPGVFNLVGSGSYDVFVCKYNTSGNLVWAKGFGSTAMDYGYSIDIDATGNVYTTGYFQGTVDFDPGAGIYNLTSSGQLDVFVSKLDINGNFLWARKFGGSGNDYGFGIKVNSLGEVHTTGSFLNTVDFDPGPGTANLTSFGGSDVYVSKLDASGNYIWARQFGGTGPEQGFSIGLDASGNVLTTGFFQLTCDFDPGVGVLNLISGGADDIFINKLNSAGNLVWARSFVGSGAQNDNGRSLTIDASGNVYSTGMFGNFGATVDFDPGAGTYTLASSGFSDAYISKLDASGNFVFAKHFVGTGASQMEIGQCIRLDASGNIYTCGDFYGVTDFDPGVGTYTINSASVGNPDGYISKLDASGNFVWAVTMGGASNEFARSLDLDPLGNIYTLGFFNSMVDFDPWAGIYNLTNVGGYDIYVQKLANCASAPSQPTSIAGNNPICEFTNQTYSVTPVGGATSYSWSTPGGFVGTSTTNVLTTTAGVNSGVISVTAINACGSSLSQTLSVTVNNAPLMPGTISGTTTLCSGAGANNYSISPVVGATSYTWSLPGGWSGTSSTNTISATPGTTGIFTVTASNSCGTSPQRTLNVTVNTTPTITVNSGSICSGQSFTIVPGGASTYTFSSGPVVSPLVNTSYSITGTSAQGCISSNTAISNVSVTTTPTANAGSSATITCATPSLSLNGSGVTTYTWSGPGIISGGNTANPAINAGGTYSLVGSTSGCNSNTSTVSVSVNTIAPTVSITASSNTVCAGASVTLTASGANTYTWNFGPSAQVAIVSYSATTSYTVVGTNTANGCQNSYSITIYANPLPIISANTTNTLICTGQSATLTASGASTYTFNPGGAGASIVVSPTVNTTYTITGTSAQGCVNTTTFTQLVDPCLGINQIAIANNEINIYPNPFSSSFTISLINNLTQNPKLEIYNSLGSLIYTKDLIQVENKIELSEYPNGIYFIRIGSINKKIIKQ